VWREKKLATWRKKKNPRQGPGAAKSCYCLSNHFHGSGIEGRVCDELRLRKIAGVSDPNGIKDYRREVTIKLELDGCKLGTQRVDFITDDLDGGITIVEAKGIAWPKWKRDWDILQHMHKGNPLVRFVVIRR